MKLNMNKVRETYARAEHWAGLQFYNVKLIFSKEDRERLQKEYNAKLFHDQLVARAMKRLDGSKPINLNWYVGDISEDWENRIDERIKLKRDIDKDEIERTNEEIQARWRNDHE